MIASADMHVHSTFSVDAKDDLTAMCQAAIAGGLRYVCFTEHLDHNPLDHGYGFYQEEAFFQAVADARHRFADRLQILKGVEFSEPQHYPEEFARLATKDYDLILGGIHAIDSLYMGDPLLRQRLSSEEIFERYYSEVLAAVRFGGFDVLAHFDLPKRYLGTVRHPEGLVDEIIREMVRSDIALEINTSPLRKGLDECAPDLAILRRYVAAGGSKVTFGSDAHSCAEVGAGFDHAYALVVSAGAGSVGLFQHRQFVPLIGKTGSPED